MFHNHHQNFHEAAMIHHHQGHNPSMHNQCHAGPGGMVPPPHMMGHRGGMPPFMPPHGFVPPHLAALHAAAQHHQQQLAQQREREVNNSGSYEPIPTPTKNRGTGTGTPGATPSRALNFSMAETPLNLRDHASPLSGARTLPHAGPRMPGLAPAVAGGSSPMIGGQSTMSAEPKFTKRLELELHNGSKDDLVKLVMELCNLNGEVMSYVESKAQLFALRPAQTDSGSPYSYTSSSHDTAVPFTTETPMKRGTSPDEGTSPSHITEHAESIDKDDVGESASKSLANAMTPHSPLEELTHDLETRHCTADDREFSAEEHPCLRLYANCRYPTSCPFRNCPRNLCINWLRGECTAGKECPMVHRLPKNASQQIVHMVSVCRGESFVIPDEVPSNRELFNASTCSDVANVTLDEEGHAQA